MQLFKRKEMLRSDVMTGIKHDYKAYISAVDYKLIIIKNYVFHLCQQFVCTFYVLFYFCCIMFDPWAKLDNSVNTELCYPGKRSFNK